MEYSSGIKRRRSSRKRTILLASVALVIISIVAIGFFLASADNKGVIVDAPVNSDKHGPTIKDFSGKFIFFRYSGIYDPKNSTLGDTDLEASVLTANTNYDKHIAVAVSRPQGGQLDYFSPYIARKTRTDLYQRQDLTVAGASAVLFIKQDNTERTVFIPHDGMIATLSFVSGGTYDDLQSEINQLLTTFSWKQ